MRLYKRFLSVILIVALCFSFQCPLLAAEATASGKEAKGTPVILDTDLGNSTDDLFALEVLYRLMDLGLVDLKAIVMSRPGDDFAALADIENTYYGYANIPIGIDRSGIENSGVYIDYRMLDDLKKPDGTKMFKRTDTNMKDNPDGYKLYRKILSEAEDHSVKIIVIGFISNIVKLLESQPDEYSSLNGFDLVAQKADSLYFMGTKLGENNEPGYNLRYDIPLARRFVTEWPSTVPVYLSPSPVGDTIDYPKELVLADLYYDEYNPIRQVYENKDCNTGQRMWDHLCVINAIFPGCFEYSNRGRLYISEQGQTTFLEDPAGPFRYQLMEDSAWSAKQLEYLRVYTLMH